MPLMQGGTCSRTCGRRGVKPELIETPVNVLADHGIVFAFDAGCAGKTVEEIGVGEIDIVVVGQVARAIIHPDLGCRVVVATEGVQPTIIVDVGHVGALHENASIVQVAP